MERVVNIERLDRDSSGTFIEANGTVEMMGTEVRWEAEWIASDSRWAARLLPGQFDADTEALAEVFLDNPPLRDDIAREVQRTLP